MPVLRIITRQLLVLSVILGCSGFCLPAQKDPSREYQVKAVFLFNFTQFVNWPSSSFATEQSSLVIGVLGENPFGSYLEETVSGERINGHPVTVRYCKDEEEAKTCHLLFINLPEAKKRKEVLDGLKGKNILTVSDANDFSKQGGMIRFFTRSNKIKLQINLDAASASKLVFSSKLLRLAEIYKSNEMN